MAEPAVDHQRRFQAAVDVIHNLPKNGTRPSTLRHIYPVFVAMAHGPLLLRAFGVKPVALRKTGPPAQGVI